MVGGEQEKIIGEEKKARHDRMPWRCTGQPTQWGWLLRDLSKIEFTTN